MSLKLMVNLSNEFPGKANVVKQVEYTDSEFNMRREFYKKTVRQDKKADQKRAKPRSNSTRAGHYSKAKA